MYFEHKKWNIIIQILWTWNNFADTLIEWDEQIPLILLFLFFHIWVLIIEVESIEKEIPLYQQQNYSI